MKYRVTSMPAAIQWLNVHGETSSELWCHILVIIPVPGHLKIGRQTLRAGLDIDVMRQLKVRMQGGDPNEGEKATAV